MVACGMNQHCVHYAAPDFAAIDTKNIFSKTNLLVQSFNHFQVNLWQFFFLSFFLNPWQVEDRLSTEKLYSRQMQKRKEGKDT